MTGGQFVDPRAIDGSIEGEVEVVQKRISRKSAAFGAGRCALLSHVEFVLENDFQELMVRSLLASASLRRNSKVLSSPRDAVSAHIFEGVVGHSRVDGAELMKSE